MNDASAYLLEIRKATRTMRDALCSMHVTSDTKQQLSSSIQQLKYAIQQLEQWVERR